MKKQTRFSTTLCILLIFALLLGACSKAEPSTALNNSSVSAAPSASEPETPAEQPVALDSARTVSVLEISGDVTVKSNGQDVDAFQGMRLRQGDVITTGAGAVAHLDLDSNKLVTLDGSSSVSLEVLSGDAQNQKTTLTLLAGTACSSVSKLSDTSSYDVKTANFTMGVRGTIFVVQVDPQTGNPEVSVVEGQVEAKPDTASEDGMLISSQQSASPTLELWEAFLANPAMPVTRALDISVLSDPILSTIIVELEQRAQALPVQQAELTKIADGIKAARPEAAAGADGLKQQLDKARETLGLPSAPIAKPTPSTVAPKPAVQTPATPPAKPDAPKTDNPDKSDKDDNQDDNSGNNNPSQPDGGGGNPSQPDGGGGGNPSQPDGGGGGNPSQPDGGGGNPVKPPQPKPEKLKMPVVTVQSFTQNGIDISFAPIANAVSYSISVGHPLGGSIYSHSLPAPPETGTITFAHTFDTPLQQSALYQLRVTAVASNAAYNSNAFILPKYIEVSTQNFNVSFASFNYKSATFDISSYPQGASAYDVLVRNTATNDVYLEATGTHAHFESDLDTTIDATGEYELVITPKRAGDDDDDDDDDDDYRHQNNQFAPYRLKVTMTKLPSPSIVTFEVSSESNQLKLNAKLAQDPTHGSTQIIEAEFYRDGAKLVNNTNWRVTPPSDDFPQSFVAAYSVNGAPAAIPSGNYTAKIRTIDTSNGGIPSDWVDTDTAISIP